MLFGGSMMSMQQSNDPSGVMIVLGLLFFVPGFIIAAVVVFNWLAAKLYSSFGDQTKLYVRGGVGLLAIAWIAWSLISSAIRQDNAPPRRAADPEQFITLEALEERLAERDYSIAANAPRPEIAKLAPKVIEGLPDAHEQVFETPFSVQSASGKIRSGPGTQFSQIGSLTRDGTVQVLAVTDVQWASFLWYRIRHESGLEGYVAGGLLCATEYWVDGTHHNCEVF
jgi:hypothetical protein